ncbi:MAG: hypothetical protein RBT63_02925 [Bdellovibrionales bacterium]|jgi:hypothetical protein|nr:hypothetical protein [Bdellovibrionales bacterium]
MAPGGAITSNLFPIDHLDRDGNALAVGDHVGFILRGWFLPREQEAFGHIASIDSRGGIKIDVIENYKMFTSSQHIAQRVTRIYFTHHTYDAQKRARVYSKKVGTHTLSIFKVTPGMDDASTPPATTP